MRGHVHDDTHRMRAATGAARMRVRFSLCLLVRAAARASAAGCAARRRRRCPTAAARHAGAAAARGRARRRPPRRRAAAPLPEEPARRAPPRPRPAPPPRRRPEPTEARTPAAEPPKRRRAASRRRRRCRRRRRATEGEVERADSRRSGAGRRPTLNRINYQAAERGRATAVRHGEALHQQADDALTAKNLVFANNLPTRRPRSGQRPAAPRSGRARQFHAPAVNILRSDLKEKHNM